MQRTTDRKDVFSCGGCGLRNPEFVMKLNAERNVLFTAYKKNIKQLSFIICFRKLLTNTAKKIPAITGMHIFLNKN